MKKLAAAVMTAMTMAAVPMAVAPAAHADICAGAHGRHIGVGGCTPGLAGDAIAGAIVASELTYSASSCVGIPIFRAFFCHRSTMVSSRL